MELNLLLLEEITLREIEARETSFRATPILASDVAWNGSDEPKNIPALRGEKEREREKEALSELENVVGL